MSLPRTYILCAACAGSFNMFAERARAQPGWSCHELATGHDAIVTVPNDLATLVLGAV